MKKLLHLLLGQKNVISNLTALFRSLTIGHNNTLLSL